MVILLSNHIGVRSRVSREEDYRRANGLHTSIPAVLYFFPVICFLILLVNWITS